MLTKKQFAEVILQEFLDSHRRKKWDDCMVTWSTKAGKAAEFLGLVKDPDAKAYLSERGGMVFMYTNHPEIAFLNFDEIINLLPDKIDVETE